MIAKRLLDLLEKSVLVTGLITIVVVFGAVWMAINQIRIPEWYNYLLATVIGFFFGSKAHHVHPQRKEV